MRQHKESEILILTSRFGNGHYSVAEALSEEYRAQGKNVQILDVMELAFPKLHKTIYNVFNKIICRNGNIYNFCNSFGRLGKAGKPNKRVMEKVAQLSPNRIITTWSGCGKMLGFTTIPVTVCITDMGFHLGWIYSWAKNYLVASENVAKKLEQCGVHTNKIEVRGIPVKRAFYGATSFAKSNKKLLIMGGGLGIIPWLNTVLEEVVTEKTIEITVIAGRNQKLYDDLKSKYKTICVIGFTKELHKYLAQADLVLSKPGGVSIFESIYVGTPFVAIYPEYEHEIENANYLIENQIGTVVWKGQSVKEQVLALMENRNRLSSYHQFMISLRNSFCEGDNDYELERVYENAV